MGSITTQPALPRRLLSDGPAADLGIAVAASERQEAAAQILGDAPERKVQPV